MRTSLLGLAASVLVALAPLADADERQEIRPATLKAAEEIVYIR